MSKTKCVVCSKAKGKRGCKLHQLQLVCPRCCADIRNADCSGCGYYSQAETYAVERMKKSGAPLPTIARMDPVVNDEVDRVLTMAEAGNVKEAEPRMQALLEQHPDLYSTHFGMGIIHSMKGDHQIAQAHYVDCVKIFPYFAAGWYNIAIACQYRKDIPGMLKAFQKSVEYGSGEEEFVRDARETLRKFDAIQRQQGSTLEDYLEGDIIFQRAYAQMKQGEYTDAIAEFIKARELNPGSPAVYGNLGLCYGFLGRKQAALAAFDQALAIDPEYEVAFINRALMEKLEEDEKLPPPKHFKDVNYYAEYGDFADNNKSLIQEFVEDTTERLNR